MVLRMGALIKKEFPHITIVAGGGYVNTELRQMLDVRLFEFIDYLSFDDGEMPLTMLGRYLKGDVTKDSLISMKYLENERVVDSVSWDNALSFNSLPSPDFSDLYFDKYISLVEFTNVAVENAEKKKNLFFVV